MRDREIEKRSRVLARKAREDKGIHEKKHRENKKKSPQANALRDGRDGPVTKKYGVLKRENSGGC